MATTTNFSWVTPNDTDLVKDGASAIRTLGSSIDSSMGDLKGGTTGQVLSKASGTDMDFTWVAQDDSNAIQNALLTTTGDTIYASGASTPARLGIGTTGQILTVTGGVPVWANAPAGGMTLLSTTSWANGSAGNVTVSSINQTYTHLFIYAYGFNPSSANGGITIKPNNTGSANAQAGVYSNASSVATAYVASAADFAVYPIAIGTGTGNHAFSMWIYNYANTSAYKPMTASGSITATTNKATNMSGTHHSNTAISSLVFNVGGANSISGGTILIYGVN
jgi:hypothetical protein